MKLNVCERVRERQRQREKVRGKGVSKEGFENEEEVWRKMR